MSNQDQIELVGAKVLMVDDIPANLQVLRGVLEPCGFRILFAPRGDVALRVARSELPDLILLDVMMPEMDGLEVCRRLKLDPATAEIPVIFITAKNEVEDVVKGLRAGGVDNEIRTPMNSVLGMTALLLETLLAAEQRDFVETIQTSSRSLLGIINEILDFSKIESGRMTLESQPFDLTAAVEEALDILGNKAAEKQLDLAYLPEQDLPATLVGDVTRFRQILLNLAGNALKFTARGEVVITAARERSEGSGAEAPVISLRILLADDHAVNQRVGSRILLGFGYRCEIAGNGLEVIEALERQPFDIVFLDVQMPQQDGYETARQIRKRWSEAERPRLIAITANAFQGDREKCLEAGMDHYIAKPVEIADIWKALERWGAPRGHARPESSDAEAGSPAASRQTVGSAEAAPDEMIDWTRFHEMLGDDSATVREFLNLYYSQASAQIENLDAALKSANASEVEMLAHKCKGASATCGLNAMVRPMAELERATRSGDLSSGGKLLAEAQASHDRVREILSIRLRSLEAPSEQRNKGNL